MCDFCLTRKRNQLISIIFFNILIIFSERLLEICCIDLVSLINEEKDSKLKNFPLRGEEKYQK